MADLIRAALVQATWTGDKESMIDLHERYARDAAAQGTQVICFNFQVNGSGSTNPNSPSASSN